MMFIPPPNACPRCEGHGYHPDDIDEFQYADLEEGDELPKPNVTACWVCNGEGSATDDAKLFAYALATSE